MKHLSFLLLLLFLVSSCKKLEAPTVSDSTQANETLSFALPDWAKNANIYEVNIRQYTDAGSFSAFAAHLPRLKEMGVDILWLMPIFPISQSKRKGTLGSYYAVSDFRKVNPEFGTEAEFDAMIKKAHDLGMHVIIDWVPNHTGWDHVWLTDHKDYYTQDEDGNVIDPIDPGTGESWGWTDVADLNYDNNEMREQMIADMEYWLAERNIDGYRMDVAHNVPDDFWETVRDRLFKGRSIYMLAEAEMGNHRNNEFFHTSYGWSLHHILNDIAKGEKNATDIDQWYKEDRAKFKKGFHMHFTSNHDENSWSGTEFERMGDAHKTFAALVSTFDGTPLIYSGQEEPLKRRLEFFEKDNINFGSYSYANFYKKLLNLKHDNQALWNGEHGGELKKILNDENVYAFKREKNGDEFIGIFNLSNKTKAVDLDFNVDLKNVMTGEKQFWNAGENLILAPWQYFLLSNK